MTNRFSSFMATSLIAVALLLAARPSEGGSFRLMWNEEATIADIRVALEARELTCHQLVQMYIDRIEAYDKKGPALNAIIMGPSPMRSMRNSLVRVSQGRCIASR